MKSDNSLHVLRVKIWLETTNSESLEQEWRGEIRDLESGDIAYFRTLDGFAGGLRKLGLVDDD